MIRCEILNKDFACRKSMLKELVSNKEQIINLKKATIKNSSGVSLKFFDTDKGEATKEVKGLEDGFIYPVISNTNYIDSHKDVHLNGSMTKTINEQQGKVHYIVNHDLSIGKVIAYPKDVEMLLKSVSWKDLGKKMEGNTEVLLFKTKLYDYSNDDARKVIENKLPAENSIRMQYLKIEMGVMDRDEDFKEENTIWDKYIGQVANRKEAEKDGYAFFVKELKIVQEGSMVLLGSNDATPILHKEIEPLKDTQTTEPTQVTQESKLSYFQILTR